MNTGLTKLKFAGMGAILILFLTIGALLLIADFHAYRERFPHASTWTWFFQR